MNDGCDVGEEDGGAEGAVLGFAVGDRDGVKDGAQEGRDDGIDDIDCEGVSLGVGVKSTIKASLGNTEGAAVDT